MTPTREARLPPGYTSVSSTKALTEQKFKLRKSYQTLDALIEKGMVIAGSPKTVRETLIKRQKDMGLGNLIAMLQIATQPPEQTETSLRLFASQVAPQLRDL